MPAVIIAAAVGFFFALLGTPTAIRGLTALRAGQPIRDVNPEAHQAKRGTPTMGGLVFISGTLIAYVVGHVVMKQLPPAQIVPPGPTITGLVLLGLMVGCAAIGFLDDFLKVARKNTAGLAGRWKLVLQVLVGLGFGAIALTVEHGTGQTVGSTHVSFLRDIRWGNVGMVAAIVVVMALVLATTNGVNLTDGLDGLATGSAILVLFGYLVISFWQYRHWCGDPHYSSGGCYVARDPLESALIAAAAVGALVGFLWWNTSPAKIIMGDTGSMALGGLIAGEAVATHTVLLLPILALLFVIITMSRMIQYTSWKLRHKRVFLMSPLHHHFEMAGWSEINIVIRFWVISGIGVCIALGLFYSEFLSRPH